MSITREYSNSINITERTLAQQSNVDTEWRQKFNELRSRYPRVDMMTLIDAASQAVAETKAIEQQLADAIERTAETVAENERLLANYRQELYEAGYQAFLDGSAGGYKPGRNRYWYEGYNKAADEEYAACRQNDDIGRDESLYPWRY